MNNSIIYKNFKKQNSMDKINFENVRILLASTIAYLVAFFAPTVDSLFALLIAFAFNIFCGMRADGITIFRCKNFSASKLWKALAEFLIYITINLVLFATLKLQGSEDVAPIMVTSVTWILVYIYISNSLKNLVKAYPTTMGFRILYHLIRFEFKKMLPSYLKEIIDRVDRFEKDKEAKDKKDSGSCGCNGKKE